MLALNEKEITLNSGMCVIADAKEIRDIGGIMGGEHSGVTAETTNVVLEIAYFEPENIARTGQKLAHLTSDARSRFERGSTPRSSTKGWLSSPASSWTFAADEASAVVRAGGHPVDKRSVDFDFGRTRRSAGSKCPSRAQTPDPRKYWL